MPRAPKCLHVPPLKAGKPAELSWEMLEGVDEYELDCVYDETFDEASTGREWADINGAELSWADIAEKDFTWQDFQQLPTRGATWSNLQFAGLTWDEIHSKDMTWRDIATVPVRFTVYRGSGDRVPGPEDGWTWQNIAAYGATWQEIHNQDVTWQDMTFAPGTGLSWQDINGAGMSWQEIEETGLTWRDFALQPSRGMDWGTLQAHWLSWEQIHQKNLSWEDLRTCTDRRKHAGFTIEIPKRKKKAQFRVRTYKDGTPSDYLLTELLDVKPAFDHEDTITLQVEKGNTYLVAIQGQGAESFEDIEMTVLYDAKLLELQTGLLPEKDVKQDWITHSAGPVITNQRAGTLEFLCTRQIPEGKEWSGLVLCMSFTALATGDTTIVLQ